MIPYINEITNYSNLFPKPKILKQIDNDTLLITPSPLSNPSKSYLIQNIKGVDNKLYYLPPKYSTNLLKSKPASFLLAFRIASKIISKITAITTQLY